MSKYEKIALIWAQINFFNLKKAFILRKYTWGRYDHIPKYKSGIENLVARNTKFNDCISNPAKIFVTDKHVQTHIWF